MAASRYTFTRHVQKFPPTFEIVLISGHVQKFPSRVEIVRAFTTLWVVPGPSQPLQGSWESVRLAKFVQTGPAGADNAEASKSAKHQSRPARAREGNTRARIQLCKSQGWTRRYCYPDLPWTPGSFPTVSTDIEQVEV